MRNNEPKRPSRWLSRLLIVFLLAVVSGLGLWTRQQVSARRLAEDRAATAEAQLESAQASMTVVARTAAVATATAVADDSNPEVALRHALDLVFEAYKDPSDGKLRALSDAFSPDALNFEGQEAERLISGGLHLAGSTPYQLQVISNENMSSGVNRISTHEIWTYDLVDADNHPTRCFHEESDQTYELHRVAAGWLIQSISLTGATRHTDC
jgi:hypothetical protein